MEPFRVLPYSPIRDPQSAAFMKEKGKQKKEKKGRERSGDHPFIFSVRRCFVVMSIRKKERKEEKTPESLIPQLSWKHRLRDRGIEGRRRPASPRSASTVKEACGARGEKKGGNWDPIHAHLLEEGKIRSF